MSQSTNATRNTSAQQGNNQTQNSHQPQKVFHIPIFVEGRNETVNNKNLDTPDFPDGGIKQSPSNEMPKPGSIFNRVKSFPVRFDQEFKKSPSPNNRGVSPGRNIPVNVTTVTREETNVKNDQQQQQHHLESHHEIPLNPSPVNQDPIHKIQNIQKDVLNLIDQLEHIVITSKKDKEYLYLDEMLTQNLLKLDTIDTENSENIKQARRAAIKCINKCIEVLEVKAEAGSGGELKTSNSNTSDYDNHQQQNDTQTSSQQ